MTPSIFTERLELRPMTPGFLRASISGQLEEAQRLLGAALPDDWDEMIPVLRMRLVQLDANPALQPWLLRAMVLRSTGDMVGHIGFHDAPGALYLLEWNSAGAELGFSVIPECRRQGYAREAALGLMQWAAHLAGVTSFVLSISPENAPSRALAKALGFARVGAHMDDVDGIEDVFIRSGLPELAPEQRAR